MSSMGRKALYVLLAVGLALAVRAGLVGSAVAAAPAGVAPPRVTLEEIPTGTITMAVDGSQPDLIGAANAMVADVARAWD